MENKTLVKLAEAWNTFIEEFGPSITTEFMPDDLDDFRKCIHDAQRIAITRQVLIKERRENVTG